MLYKLRSVAAAKGGYLQCLVLAQQILRREGVSGLVRRLTALREPQACTQHFADDLRSSPIAFVNEAASARPNTLLSDWHRGIIGARRLARGDFSDLPEVTLTAVTHNSARWLPGFLRSLDQLKYPDGRIHLVVVDCASEDDSCAIIEAYSAENSARVHSVTLICEGNIGFGRAQNAAIAQARTDLVLITNVDVAFPAETLVTAVGAALADSPEVAAWELRQEPFEHPKYFDPVTLQAAWQSHACVLMRRSHFQAVGGFDPRIFLYGEDVELSYRLRAAGFVLRYLPWVTVTHFVEFGVPDNRPSQLSNSLAANVLLRFRYATRQAAEGARAALRDLRKRELDPMRQKGIDLALRTISRDARHFATELRPSRPVCFPFDGFDYMLAREGYTKTFAPPLPTTEQLPLVTVVTRHHGVRTELLEEAIASVLNQTYPNIEHLIVEDRSDHAASLIARVREGYGVNIRHLVAKGAGRSSAGNSGLAAARGEYLLFLDNDDLLFPDHVETLVRVLLDQRDAVCAYTLSWEVEVAAKPDGGRMVAKMSTPDVFRREFSVARLKHSNFIPIQAAMFRRRAYDLLGGMDETLDQLEDWHLWNRYATLGPFVRVSRLTSIFHTPADPDIRARRQEELHAAYGPVKEKIMKAVKR